MEVVPCLRAPLQEADYLRYQVTLSFGPPGTCLHVLAVDSNVNKQSQNKALFLIVISILK